ncbi:hypothetical protein HPP92_018331 [Vanilla planifolia]|uniref:Uncharacterized protein n=1 Tax=Vanilla planifolia TaxID=51239 RepID=A0A835UPA4_VANPL|nr:hypothetical protein HPP92_018331 [Vanilla planifolia]
MANYEQGKMKRKDMDAFCEDLFDVSLCPPATKIRRLASKAVIAYLGGPQPWETPMACH